MVAINGAEEVAGSTPTHLKIKGRIAPAIVPQSTTPTKDKAIVIAIITQYMP